ncbi:hypothetical protein QM480_06440 [Flectobacillus sp. DC10W]|uniref:Uncharacterized protein n=1 Tax=Flectobacillus longus TaxID=2984207 RepID=A0ABT6YLC2_9BACT|nr:hypothetical protein [Flectobacillus longus]MDI9863953.1 hypothetical protein [Flectobacillus longus]
MENIKLIKKNTGEVIPLRSEKPFRGLTKADYFSELNGEETINITIVTSEFLKIEIGDYCIVNGRKWTINTPVDDETKKSRHNFEYSFTLDAESYKLKNVLFFDEDVNGNSTSTRFVAVGDLAFWIQLIVNNVNRVYPNFFTEQVVLADTDEKQLTFSSVNCLEALQTICKEFDVDFNVVEINDTDRRLEAKTIGKLIPYKFEYGWQKGLYNLSRKAVDNSNVVTRLYVFGSTKNIPSSYRNYSDRLRLPSGADYIEDPEIVYRFGIIEDELSLDEIFPTRTASLTAVSSTSLFEFSDSTMDFDLNSYLAPGVTAKINFKSGNLSGYTFDIVNYNNSTKTFRIKQFKDSAGQLYPNENIAFKFQTGDKYTLVDILPPVSYITEAENRLLAEGSKQYNKIKRPKIKYVLTLDDSVVKKFVEQFGVGKRLFEKGDRIPIVDKDFGVDQEIRILSVTNDLMKPFSYSLELAEFVFETRLEQVVSATKTVRQIVKTNTQLVNPAEQKQNWQTSVSDIVDWSPFEKLEKGLSANTPAFLSFNSEGVRLIFSGDGINDTVDTETPNPTIGLVWAENHKVKTTIDPMDIDALNLGALFSANNATLQNIAIVARAFPKSRPDLSLLPDLNFLGEIGTTYMNEVIIRGRYTVRWEIQSNYESYANGYTEYLIATPTLPDTRIQISRSIKRVGGSLIVLNKSTYPLIIEDSIQGNYDFLLEPNEIVRLFLPENYSGDNTVKYIAEMIGSGGGTVDLTPFEHFEFGLKAQSKAMIDITDEENTLLLSSDSSNSLGDESEAMVVAKSKKSKSSNRGGYFEASGGTQENRALTLKATVPSSASTTPDYIGGKKGLALDILEGATILDEFSALGKLGKIIDLPNSTNTITIGFEDYIELNPTGTGKMVLIQAGGKKSGGSIVFHNRSAFSLEVRYQTNFYFQLEPKSYVELMVDSDGVARLSRFFGNSAKLPQKYAFLGGLTELDIIGSEFLEIASSSSNSSSPTRIKILTNGQGLGKELFIYNASVNSVIIENTITGNSSFTLISGAYLKIKKVSTGWISI